MAFTFTSFVVAGAGGIGSVIASALLAAGNGVKVTILTRGGNNSIPAGAAERVIDYANPDGIEAALRDVKAEVVVSTVGWAALSLQIQLADAAKRAGVRLFVPSEYGHRSHETPWGALNIKNEVKKHLNDLGLPYTVYYTGLFTDLPLNMFPGLMNIPERTLSVVGTGDAKISFTTKADIAHFVAYTLTRLPVAQLENAILGVEASKLSWKEVVAIWGQVFGVPFELKTRDADEVKAKIDDGSGSAQDLLLWMIGIGLHDVGEYNHTSLVPGWTPEPYEKAVKTVYTIQ